VEVSGRALVSELCALAFARAAPAEANVAIARARERFDGRGVSYEVVLPGFAPEEFLARQVLPKLVHFLCSRGVRLPGSGGVFVSLFTGDGLFFVEAGPFAVRVGAERALDADELMRRYRPDGPGDPLLLGR
jgi:hypothetical protein